MSTETCPTCGNILAAPNESVDRQLTALIDAGCDSEAAAEQVVESLPDAHRHWALPVMRREAHRIARGRDRRVEHAAIGTDERWRMADSELRARLLRIEFSLGNGEKVTWGKATWNQFKTRKEMYGRERAGINAGEARVDRAMQMLRPDGVPVDGRNCLEDIAGSEQILLGLDGGGDTNAEVATPAGGSARKPTTSANTPRRERGKVPTASRA